MGFENARVVAFGTDPGRTSIDEPSPTTLDVGRLLIGFLIGGVVLGAVAVLLARPLQRRLGPAIALDTEPDGDTP
jgi:hypothetical protein